MLPDRPEIRGMLARVPHLVDVTSVDQTREADDEGPRPPPARRLDPTRAGGSGRGIAGKGGKTAGRGTKGQGARDTIRPGSRAASCR